MFNLSQIPIFALADRKLAWIDQRQGVLAADIANADTPGWRAHDLTPFAARLGQHGVSLARTDPAHLGGSAALASAAVVQSGERAPDGNGVALDQQMMKLADTDTAQELATELTRSYLGLFRTAIGR